ncbi:MAG: hypothetical protein KBA11_08450, partial [Sedimentibacter sp.]|nr:hypothetical protein [Sedimentibacter sp.]
ILSKAKDLIRHPEQSEGSHEILRAKALRMTLYGITIIYNGNYEYKRVQNFDSELFYLSP